MIATADGRGWVGMSAELQPQMDADGWVLYEVGSCLADSGAFTLLLRSVLAKLFNRRAREEGAKGAKEDCSLRPLRLLCDLCGSLNWKHSFFKAQFGGPVSGAV